MARQNPGWKVMVCNVTAVLTKGSDSAEFWLTVKGNNNPHNCHLNRESVSILYWRKRS